MQTKSRTAYHFVLCVLFGVGLLSCDEEKTQLDVSCDDLDSCGVRFACEEEGTKCWSMNRCGGATCATPDEACWLEMDCSPDDKCTSETVLCPSGIPGEMIPCPSIMISCND